MTKNTKVTQEENLVYKDIQQAIDNIQSKLEEIGGLSPSALEKKIRGSNTAIVIGNPSTEGYNLPSILCKLIVDETLRLTSTGLVNPNQGKRILPVTKGLTAVGTLIDDKGVTPPLLLLSNGVTVGCNKNRTWSTSNRSNQIKIPDEDLEMFNTLEAVVSHILLGIGLYKVDYTKEESQILQQWLRESDKYHKIALSGWLLREIK